MLSEGAHRVQRGPPAGLHTHQVPRPLRLQEPQEKTRGYESFFVDWS